MNKIDTCGMEEIVCPHCAYQFDCSFEYMEDDGELIECPGCGSQMELGVHYGVTYSTEKPDWLEQWRTWNRQRKLELGHWAP